MKETFKKNKIFILITIIFIICTVIMYFYTYTPAYSSLENAIKITARGGKAVAKMRYDGGYFVFLKNAPMKYDYYYPIDKKWYNKGVISTKNYNIKDRYKVTIYYVQRNKISFIKVQTSDNDIYKIKDLSDSLDTTFNTLKVSRNDVFYFGGTYEQIPEGYTITINGKEYLLKEYNELFKLFQ